MRISHPEYGEEKTERVNIIRKVTGTHLVWWVSLLLLAGTVVYPSLVLIATSVRRGGRFSLANFIDMFQNPDIRVSMVNSFEVVIPATLIATMIGVSLAWIIGRTNVPGRKVWELLLLVPYIIPPFIGSICWTYLLGPVGFITTWLEKIFGLSNPPFNIYSLSGMIFVMSVYGYAIPYIVVLPVISRIDSSLEEAAQISGAKPRKVIWDVIVPLVMPSVFAGMLLLFMNLLSDFGVPSILGTPNQIYLMTTEIYNTIMSPDLPNNLNIAASTSIILAVIGIIIMQIYQRTSKSANQYVVISGKSTVSEPLHLRSVTKILACGFMTIVVFVSVMLPIAATVITSLIKAYGQPITLSNLGFANYGELLSIDDIKRAFVNSFGLAIVAALVICVLGTALAYMAVRKRSKLVRFLEVAIVLPYAVPGTIVALSMILAFSQPVLFGMVSLYGTIGILLVAYIARFINLGYQTITSSIVQLSPSLEEASRISGASELSTFRKITMPLLKGSVNSAFLLVVIPVLAEITLSSLLWSVNHETIGVIVFSAQEEGKLGITAALATVVIVVVTLLNSLYRVLTGTDAGKSL